MGEHSPVDALVPSIVCEYGVVEGVDAGMFAGAMELGEEGWERLEWVVDDKIEKECQRAEADARALIVDSDDSGLWFTNYGADWIKDVGTFSLPVIYILRPANKYSPKQPNSLQTLTSKWPSSSHGTKPVASSQRRTKPL